MFVCVSGNIPVIKGEEIFENDYYLWFQKMLPVPFNLSLQRFGDVLCIKVVT